MRVGELAPWPVMHGMGEGDIAPLPLAPCHLLQVGKAGPGVTRMGDLIMFLTECSTWENGPCTSLRQCLSDPIDRSRGKPGLWM